MGIGRVPFTSYPLKWRIMKKSLLVVLFFLSLLLLNQLIFNYVDSKKQYTIVNKIETPSYYFQVQHGNQFKIIQVDQEDYDNWYSSENISNKNLKIMKRGEINASN